MQYGQEQYTEYSVLIRLPFALTVTKTYLLPSARKVENPHKIPNSIWFF